MTGGSEDEGKSGARAILRAPAVIAEVAARPGGASLAQIAGRLAIPKASLLRILRMLEGGGYIRQEAGGYRLGESSFHLARLIGIPETASGLTICARPELRALADASGETVMLGELSDTGDEIVYVDVIDSSSPVRFIVRVGDRRPLYCAAAGQALLAFLPDAEQRRYLDATAFIPFNAETADRATLAALLPGVRLRGIAFDAGGRVEGATGIASPVFAASGRGVAAVSVAGPSGRMAERRATAEAQVVVAGERISRALGYRGEYPPGRE